MFDLQERASGELVLEMVTIDKLRAFLSELMPFDDLNFLNLNTEEVRWLLEGHGYNLYQID
jgi:hypothetical protein